MPCQAGTETSTRFVRALAGDNAFINPDYKSNLDQLTGWQLKAWRDGDWDLCAGQYFRNYHPEIHVLGRLPESTPVHAGRALANSTVWDDLARLHHFRESDAVEWFATLNYGYTHLTVILLACTDHAGNIYIMDEHAERHWIPQRHAQAIKAMLARHHFFANPDHLAENLRARFPKPRSEREALWHRFQRRRLARFVAGGDVFGCESNGASIATQYRALGFNLRTASLDRVAGWSAILGRLGDLDAGVLLSLFIHSNCRRLLECLPGLQHDPDRSGDILKSNIADEGIGGDDAADALRYAVATKSASIRAVKLRDCEKSRNPSENGANFF